MNHSSQCRQSIVAPQHINRVEAEYPNRPIDLALEHLTNDSNSRWHAGIQQLLHFLPEALNRDLVQPLQN